MNKIKYKFYYAYDIQRKLGYDNEKFKRLLRIIKKRHPEETWIYKRLSQNGRWITMINVECVKWLEEVYFNKSKYYLDLEIEFYEKRIKEIEEKLGVEPKKFLYNDMSISELMNYFKKSRNSVDIAIYKMIKILGEDVRYKKDNKIIIKDYGVKWLNEKYYRKAYLKELEKYKIMLEIDYN